MAERIVTDGIIEQLRELAGESDVLADESMRLHTTFRVGGKAAAFVLVRDEACLRAVSEYVSSEKIPYFLAGNGSNLLVSENGYDGVILKLAGEFEEIKIEGTRITAGAAASIIKTAAVAADHGLTGLEFASGIPGSVGGAVYMNAGAYGGEIADVITEALTLEDAIKKQDLALSYRSSVFKRNGRVITGAVFELQQGDKDAIREKMEELKSKRLEKQPLEYPSAGSTFKRPEGYFAGKLIMEAGLSGFSVGDACVSEKHCGFVVNKGNATADDVYRLICLVRDKVKEHSGITLEPEVIMLGDFAD
jgi:UDP-N-acetylmuramate dehydrogenase